MAGTDTKPDQAPATPLPCIGAPRPRLFVTGDCVEGLRSLEDVRHEIQSGHPRALWEQLLDKVRREANEPAWTPETPLPERRTSAIKHANRDYGIVGPTCLRIVDASLAALINQDSASRDAAMRQIEAVFDDAQWPVIEDITHLKHGDHCSLRRGQFAFALGLAYDWLHDQLTDTQRRWFVEQFDRRMTQGFREGLEAGDRFTRMKNNFVSVIYGGFAVAAMAFGEDDAQSDWLLEQTVPRMERYISDLFGPEGEFPETVQYAGSVNMVVNFLSAMRYATRNQDNPFARHSLADFCCWYMHFTLPPGRVAGFGDPGAEHPPFVTHFSAIAAALRDPLVQWFYLQYADRTLSSQRGRALELLSFDPTLEPQSPANRLPLGRAYEHIAKLVSSRSSWDPQSAVSVVYAKAAREHNHSHADWGQVCIDGHGERLIVDLGSTAGYPPHKKILYYNYQQWGHNIFVLGAPGETGGVESPDGTGELIEAHFDPQRGGTWSFDLTSVYPPARCVQRAVAHLLPRVAMVLDDAKLQERMPISLRWHTITTPELDASGAFTVTGESARLSALVARFDGAADTAVRHHAYEPPCDYDRLGEPYAQKHEPFVELNAADDHCRVLSLFCVFGPDDEARPWRATDAGWAIETPEGPVTVGVQGRTVTVAADDADRRWSIELPDKA